MVVVEDIDIKLTEDDANCPPVGRMAKLATPPSLIVDAISNNDGFISIVMILKEEDKTYHAFVDCDAALSLGGCQFSGGPQGHKIILNVGHFQFFSVANPNHGEKPPLYTKIYRIMQRHNSGVDLIYA